MSSSTYSCSDLQVVFLRELQGYLPMRTITFEEADSLLSWNSVADALHAGHQLAKAEIGDLLLQVEPNALLSRGAWIPGLGMALKSMSVFPENVSANPRLPSIQGGVLLFDDKNGSLMAIIDGVLVTKWKTAGDSVLGAKLLANPLPKTHLMVGVGTVAVSVIDAYREVFPSIDRFIICNRTISNAYRFVETMQHKVGGLEVMECLEAACGEADIITCATMAVEPVLKGEWINAGTHVDLIGSFKPDMREADDALLLKSELFVDSRDTTIGHIGEIDIPLNAGTIVLENIRGDLYELCRNKAGRGSTESITVFKNGGGAHLDLMTSMMIYEMCN